MHSQVHPCFYMYVRVCIIVYICIYVYISGEVGASVVHAKIRLGCTREKATHLFTRMLMMMMKMMMMMMMKKKMKMKMNV